MYAFHHLGVPDVGVKNELELRIKGRAALFKSKQVKANV